MDMGTRTRNLKLRMITYTSVCLAKSEVAAEVLAGCAGVDIDYDSICYFCALTTREPVDGCE